MNNKSNSKGIFIAFEGIDGSGKSTQSNLLIEKFKEKNQEVFEVDFPQYGKKSAGLVENYLSGQYGTEEEVGPYVASIFYACDRYDGSFELRKKLNQQKILIADRYMASSLGHQGGKIRDDKKRKDYAKWLYNLEYNVFNIPRPDINFILNVSPEIAFEKQKQKAEKKRKKIISALNESIKTDIHESNRNHLVRALESYLFIAKEYPEEYIVIDCMDDKGNFLPPGEIHNKVWKEVKKKLKNKKIIKEINKIL